ncbi:hypothetical protein SLS62_003573 [Diatrype stigma]|uniref:Uncharacterized protein n=1 Tax=Diatrype stigma TaxID=117547 RepID=A0AAN9UWJ1_9PEZI
MQLVTNLLSLALVATSTWASPLVGRQSDLQLYQLQVSSPGHDTIDGQYLVANGTDIGVMLDSQTPVQVYTTPSSKEGGLLELHTYPVGIVDHAIGLHGPPGLMNMVDLANPKGKTTDDDNVVNVWDTFRLVEEKLTNDGTGKWYAFPTQRGGYVVKWYDGSIGITDDYTPVEIIMEGIAKANYNNRPN